MSIKETLEARGGKYGKFVDNARITQQLLNVLKTAPNYHDLTQPHLEAYHMILHKIARSACGDIMYRDNIVDIIGYATLLLEFIDGENAKRIAN